LQADAVHTDLDLQPFTVVLSYWRTRCLPPTTLGELSVLGVIAVRDVMFYLQYYSVPVATILLTPVVKLVVSLYQVYTVPTS
jgi:hypothetical protein